MAGYDGNYTTNSGYTPTAATTCGPWNGWVATTATDAVWRTWVVDGAAATTDSAWTNWTAGTFFAVSGGEYIARSGTVVATPPPPPKAITRGRIFSIENYRAEQDKRKARERGLDLLRWLLSPEELADLRAHESVRIRGSLGGLYEVGLNRPSLAYKIDPTTLEPMAKLGVCQTAKEYVDEDRVAALVLAFQTDEASACARAVVHTFDEAARERERVKLRRVFRIRNAA